MDSISAVSLAIVGLFILFILSKKGKSGIDYILLIYNLILVLLIIFNFDFVNQGITKFKLIIHFNASFWLSTTFLIYGYSLLTDNKQTTIKWWFFSFSGPFLLYSLWDLIPGQTGESLRETMNNPNIVYHFFFKGHKLFIIAASLNILKKIRVHESSLKLSFSSLRNVSLKWLRNYTVVTILVFTLHLTLFLLYNFQIIPEIKVAYSLTGILLFLASLYLGYFGIQQYNLKIELSEPEIAVQKSKPSSPENEEIFKKLEILFQEDLIFINPNLRIRNVADKIGTPVHKLSEAINDQFGKPFYDYVAFHRCEFLKEKLLAPENSAYTILGLALDSGFNSKSSLNRIFKEQTGLTPSQFRKSHFNK